MDGESFPVARAVAIALLALLLPAAWPVASVRAAGPAARQLALLVGVQSHESKDIDPLDGCCNDVSEIRTALARYGYAGKDVRVLLDKDATRAGILTAFQNHLIDQADGDTDVVFYYSGHGSQTLDPTGAESSQYDDTLVPYDSREQGKYDITDKEIHVLLIRLLQKTPHVTFIFDCCHSGTLERTLNLLKVRTIPRDTRPLPPNLVSAIPHVEEPPPSAFREFVQLSACRDDEESSEWPFDGVSHGAFTHSLVKALEASNEQTTYNDLIEAVKLKTAELGLVQHPNTAGNLDHRPFSRELIPTRPYYTLRPTAKGISLDGGRAHGVTAGSEYNVFPPGEKEFRGDKAIARVRVKEVSVGDSVVEVVHGPAELPTQARAVESRHVFDRSIAVFLRLTNRKLAADLALRLREIPGVSVVDAPEHSNLVVEQGNPKLSHGTEILLRDPTGRTVFDRIPDEEDAAPEVMRRLVHRLMRIAVAGVGNPVEGLQVDFDVVSAEAPASAAHPADKRRFQDREWVKLKVSNRTGVKWYITVLEFGDDGSIDQIYPRVRQDAALAADNHDWSYTNQVQVDDGKTEAHDIYKLVLTRDPIDFSGLIHGGDDEIRGQKDTPAHEIDLSRVQWATLERSVDIYQSP